MNVAGHRLSTFEIESALVDDERVAEAAVVSKPHDIKGEGIVAFVTLKSSVEGDAEVLSSLRDHVAQVIGPIAKPDEIIFTPDLPKTRSGKIMRRLLRDVARGNTLGDVTTLANAEIVEQIRDHAATASEE
jgi:acetyl-CoA synthetase